MFSQCLIIFHIQLNLNQCDKIFERDDATCAVLFLTKDNIERKSGLKEDICAFLILYSLVLRENY